MDEYILVKPDQSYIDEIQFFRLDMLLAESTMDGTGPLKRMSDIPEWLEFNERMEKKELIPDDLVTAEQFAFVRKSDQKIVGMIQLRHELNDALRNLGGHIGYSVRPDERRKGYAKQMLAACLVASKDRGLDKVLLTCNEENEASRRTILANGGTYEKTIYHEQEDAKIEHYWIEL